MKTTIQVTSKTASALRAALPPGGTYEDALRALLSRVPPDDLAAMLRRTAAEAEAAVRARLAARLAAPSVTRDPSEQRTLAVAAAALWRNRLASGSLERLGPRRYRFPPTQEVKSVVRLRKLGRGIGSRRGGA